MKNLTPWAETVVVLEGVNGETGNHLTGEQYETFHEAAIHLHPKLARELIRAGAERAAQRFSKNRAEFKPLRLDPPYRLERFMRPYRSQPASQSVSENKTSIIELFNGK